MPKQNPNPPEAQFEAQIHGTIARVFPGVSNLRHQDRFKVRVGRTEIDAGGRDYIEGRADIIVYRDDVALAVLELKREGLALTSDDEAQGRSYALLTQAPIVVLTNGGETRIFQTHDMARLPAETVDEAEVARRIKSAATAAQSSVQASISRLLGTDLARGAIAAMSASEIGELTGSLFSDARFAESFLVPRRATYEVRQALSELGHRVVLVSGPPLAGKSSVLRELFVDNKDESCDFLYLDGASCSEGIFRRLANILAVEFGWPATVDEARIWLRQFGAQTNRRLILCLDSLPADSQSLVSDIDEILSTFAKGVQIVIAVDEHEVGQLVMKRGGRERTRLGRQCVQVEVGSFDDDEFRFARQLLQGIQGRLVEGAEHAPELRAPWILRAVAASKVPSDGDERLVVLPPMLGIEVFEVANERFSALEELRDEFRRVAVVYLENLGAERKDVDKLSSLFIFSIRQDVLKDRIGREAMKELTAGGLIRRQLAPSGEVVYVIQVPELFGFELASRLSALLVRRLKGGVDDAAKWLVKTCSRMPLGDVIGAYAMTMALLDVGVQAYIQLINALLKQPPRREVMLPGTRFITLMPDVGVIEIGLGEDRTMSVRLNQPGSPSSSFKLEDEDLISVANMDGWLILSQLREYRMVYVPSAGAPFNFANGLLLELGTCPILLRKPGQILESFHTHAIEGGELSCFKNGIVEPITWAIVTLLVQDIPGVDRDDWVDSAAASGSQPLLNRLGQALSHLSDLEGIGEWAKEKYENVYRPAVAQYKPFH